MLSDCWQMVEEHGRAASICHHGVRGAMHARLCISLGKTTIAIGVTGPSKEQGQARTLHQLGKARPWRTSMH